MGCHTAICIAVGLGGEAFGAGVAGGAVQIAGDVAGIAAVGQGPGGGVRAAQGVFHLGEQAARVVRELGTLAGLGQGQRRLPVLRQAGAVVGGGVEGGAVDGCRSTALAVAIHPATGAAAGVEEADPHCAQRRRHGGAEALGHAGVAAGLDIGRAIGTVGTKAEAPCIAYAIGHRADAPVGGTVHALGVGQVQHGAVAGVGDAGQQLGGGAAVAVAGGLAADVGDRCQPVAEAPGDGAAGLGRDAIGFEVTLPGVLHHQALVGAAQVVYLDQPLAAVVAEEVAQAQGVLDAGHLAVGAIHEHQFLAKGIGQRLKPAAIDVGRAEGLHLPGAASHRHGGRSDLNLVKAALVHRVPLAIAVEEEAGAGAVLQLDKDLALVGAGHPTDTQVPVEAPGLAFVHAATASFFAPEVGVV